MDTPDRILIVDDDDPEVRQLRVDYLARNAFEAVYAHSWLNNILTEMST